MAGKRSQPTDRRPRSGDQHAPDSNHHPPVDHAHRLHGNHSQPADRRPRSGDQHEPDGNHHPLDYHAHQPHDSQTQPANRRRPNGDHPHPNDNQHEVNDSQPVDARSDSALNNTVETIRFTPNNNVDIPAAFQDVEVQLRAAIQRLLQQHRNIRGYITSNVTFSRVNDGQVIYHQQLFRSRIQVLSNEIDIEDALAEMMREIFERSQDFQAQGSGWSLVSVDNIELHMAQYKPLDASSYIRLPKEIELTKAVLNIQNEDNKCIVWAILAFLHPVNSKDNPKRVTKYQPYEHELNCTGVSFPTPLKDIKKIEQQNNISIHVFGYDVKEKVYPLLLSKKVIQDRHINLLLIGDGENRHYCLIRTFSRLMNQRTKHK